MDTEKDIFNRLALLIGEPMMENIKSKRVIIFGVGGVGSWCAESLIRSGIGELTIVDSDIVCITNINRQLQATTKTIGQVKVKALKERLAQINPYAKINAIQEIYSTETAENFNLETYDYIIDAIDSLENKARLILHATQCKGKFFSAMGAALKIDPSKIRSAEFWDIQGCPLARALRKKFKKIGQFPQKKFQCVFSPEVLTNKGDNDSADTSANLCQQAQTTEENTDLAGHTWDSSKAQINGSTVHITAIFGFTLAGLVMQDIYTGTI